MSKRVPDQNGYLTITGNPLTKAGVYEYLGREIGAPDLDRVYKVYRPAEELQDPETIDSFKLAPFIDDHEWLGEGGTPAERKGVQGMIGEQVYFDPPYLRGNIRILSETLKDKLKSGKVELSAGYKSKYDFTPGVSPDGQRFDVRQHQIRANHLALVDQGRTGADVAVLDQQFVITLDAKGLIMTIEEILAALAALSDEEKAQVLAQLNGVADADPVAEPAAPAKDEEFGDEPPGESDIAAAVTEAVEIVEAAQEAVEALETTTTSDEDDDEDKGSKAMDKLQKQIAELQKQVKAQDTGALLKELSIRDSLAKRAAKFIGTFDHSSMTAQQVAEYGVKKVGIKVPAGSEIVALDAWMHGRVPESQQARVMDSAPAGSASKFWKE